MGEEVRNPRRRKRDEKDEVDPKDRYFNTIVE